MPLPSIVDRQTTLRIIFIKQDIMFSQGQKAFDVNKSVIRSQCTRDN